MAWYRAFLRTDRKRDSKTASDYYCFFVLYISPKEPEQLDAGHCNLLHYPRYPWEQKGSYGSCTGAIEQRCLIAHSQDTSSDGTVQQAERKCDIKIVPPLVHPLRANCFALCFTMPVFAEELECREKP